MTLEKLTIAIDGPAGAGKSTVSTLLAQRLRFRLIDTGAMYRALAWSVAQAGLPAEESPALRRHLDGVAVTLDDDRVLVNGRDVSAEIRTPVISALTSRLTMLAPIRAKVTPLQRQMAAPGGVVLEGRDTGTVVCPDADVKFFLTANLESRARRRHAELAEQGVSADLDTVRDEVKVRDRQDTTRTLAPLAKAPDAIEIDTSDLSIDEVVDRMAGVVNTRRVSAPDSGFYAACKVIAVA